MKNYEEPQVPLLDTSVPLSEANIRQTWVTQAPWDILHFLWHRKTGAGSIGSIVP